MSESAPLLISAGNLPAPNWHATHEEAQTRLTRLAEALGTGNWKEVDKGAKWIYEVLRPHNEAEERELFPLLEELGAEALHQRLHEDHRQMWDLTLQLLAEISEGQVRAPRSLTLLGQRLVDLIRDHIEAEEFLMLPLLKGKSLYCSDDETQDGYLILEKKLVAPETWSFIVQAPQVARGRKPGQFFMVAPSPRASASPSPWPAATRARATSTSSCRRWAAPRRPWASSAPVTASTPWPAPWAPPRSWWRKAPSC